MEPSGGGKREGWGGANRFRLERGHRAAASCGNRGCCFRCKKFNSQRVRGQVEERGDRKRKEGKEDRGMGLWEAAGSQ